MRYTQQNIVVSIKQFFAPLSVYIRTRYSCKYRCSGFGTRGLQCCNSDIFCQITFQKCHTSLHSPQIYPSALFFVSLFIVNMNPLYLQTYFMNFKFSFYNVLRGSHAHNLAHFLASACPRKLPLDLQSQSYSGIRKSTERIQPTPHFTTLPFLLKMFMFKFCT